MSILSLFPLAFFAVVQVPLRVEAVDAAKYPVKAKIYGHIMIPKPTNKTADAFAVSVSLDTSFKQALAYGAKQYFTFVNDDNYIYYDRTSDNGVKIDDNKQAKPTPVYNSCGEGACEVTVDSFQELCEGAEEKESWDGKEKYTVPCPAKEADGLMMIGVNFQVDYLNAKSAAAFFDNTKGPGSGLAKKENSATLKLDPEIKENQFMSSALKKVMEEIVKFAVTKFSKDETMIKQMKDIGLSKEDVEKHVRGFWLSSLEIENMPYEDKTLQTVGLVISLVFFAGALGFFIYAKMKN